jgi:hypothetical protein
MVSGAAVAILAFGAVGYDPAVASAPAPPVNDNYLESLELNSAGTRLNRNDTLKDVRDTTQASVQANLLSPCGRASCPAGPPEVTSCNGTSYGNTIWYDFYPDANGLVSIRTSALFQNVITLYEFSRTTLVPDSAHALCAVSSLGGGQLIAHVKKGQAYTFQLGGVGTAGGPLDLLFDYFVPPPRRLSAATSLKAKTLPGGVQLLGLSVASARGARVAVTCGRYCRSETKPIPKFGAGTEEFPSLNGVQMPAGSKLEVLVTAPHSIGVLVRYSIVAGNFSKQTFCTEPRSRKPRRTCH